MRARSEIRLLLLTAALSVPAGVACSKHSAKSSSPDATGTQQRASEDPLAELDRLEREMNRLGLRADPPSAGAVPGASEDGDAHYEAEAEAAEQPRPSEAATDHAPAGDRAREKHAGVQQCSDVCDLSVAICDLEAQLCSLADRHRDDPTYVDACRRAGEDCDTADQACERCRS